MKEIKSYMLFLQKHNLMYKETAKQVSDGLDLLYGEDDSIEMKYTDLLTLNKAEQEAIGLELKYKQDYGALSKTERGYIVNHVGKYICSEGTTEEKVNVVASNINYYRYIKVGDTEEFRIALVQRDGTLIRGIERPQKAVRYEAINQNPLAIHHILTPTEEEQLYALEKANGNKELIAVLIQGVEMPSVDFRQKAIEINKENLAYFMAKGYEKQAIKIELGDVTSNHALHYHKKYGYLTYDNWVGTYDEFIKTFGEHINEEQRAKIRAVMGDTPPSVKTQAQHNEPKKPSVRPANGKSYTKTEVKQIMQKLMETGLYIEEVENPTEEMQIQAVTKTPSMFAKMENPSEAVIEAGLSRKGSNLHHVANPTDKQRRIALQQDGEAIMYIKNPTEAEQFIAVKQNPNNVLLIEDVAEPVLQYAVQQEPRVVRELALNETGKEYLIELNPHTINFMTNVSSEMIAKALMLDSTIIRNMSDTLKKHLTLEQKKDIVKANGYTLYYFKDAEEELIREAIASKPSSIEYVENPTEEIQLYAVQQEPSAILFINQPTEKVQMAVVQANPKYLKHIKNPTAKVQAEAEKQQAQ